MTPELELTNALAEWRRLALAEGQAIRAGNWSFVAECQQALATLRPIIDRLTHQARQVPPPPRPDSPARKTNSRAIVLELIEMQRRNLASLHRRRANLLTQVQQLSRTSQNLRGIQRSYAPPGPSGWTSYS